MFHVKHIINVYSLKALLSTLEQVRYFKFEKWKVDIIDFVGRRNFSPSNAVKNSDVRNKDIRKVNNTGEK